MLSVFAALILPALAQVRKAGFDFNGDGREVFFIDSIWYHLDSIQMKAAVCNYGYPVGHCYPEWRKEMVIPSAIMHNGQEYTVNEIEAYAFQEEAFETLSLPSTVIKIESEDMCTLPNLLSVTVDNGNPAFCAVDGVLYDKEMTSMLCFPKGKWDSGIVIPEGVERLENKLFMGGIYDKDDSSVKNYNISFPSTLKSIGSMCFWSFRADGYKLPEGLKSIAGYAFWGASSKDSTLVIPSTVSWIGEHGFYGAGFKRIILPDDLKIINDYSFTGRCLEEITLPRTLTEIGDYAFESTSSLEGIEFPEGLENIGIGAFRQSGLKSVAVRLKIERLDDDVFSYCDSLRQVVIGEDVFSIKEAFTGCAALKDIYCEGMTPPRIISEYPLGVGKRDDYYGEPLPVFTGATVHVRPGAAKNYSGTRWKEVGPIVEDLTDGVSDIYDGTGVSDDDVCDAYSLSGVAVASRLRFGEVATTLPKGLYIIRTASGKSAKLAIE